MDSQKSKRILIVTQYIYPENFRSTDMALELSRRGYKVEVLTGIPNYPQGHYFQGYGLFRKRKEKLDGVTFYRCLQTPRKLFPGFVGLSVNYLSFAFNATLWVLFFFAWKKKYDSIIAFEPSPITQIIPAIILGKIRKVPVYSWITDIWPDSVVSSTGGKVGKIANILNGITNWVYRHSTKILISSKGMRELVNRDADYNDKVIDFPYWCSDIAELPVNTVSDMPSGYNIVMAGNLGDGIGVQEVLRFAELTETLEGVNCVFIGGGSKLDEMKSYVSTHGLKHTYFLGMKPFAEMNSYYSNANVLLLTLRKTELPHLKATVPSRTQAYMSSGKPILAMIDGDASDLIKEAGCGYAVPSGDYKKLFNVLKEQVLPNKYDFVQMGEYGRKYFERYFTLEKCMNSLEEIMN